MPDQMLWAITREARGYGTRPQAIIFWDDGPVKNAVHTLNPVVLKGSIHIHLSLLCG
jgi:hypothetical protein